MQSQIQVAVNAGKEASFPGTVHELTNESAVAMFQAETCPNLIVGRVVQLVFTSATSDSIVPVEAKLTSTMDLPPMRCHSFSFQQPAQDIQSVLSGTGAVERRRASRVALEPGDLDVTMVVPADVVPLLPSIPENGTLRDGAVHIPGHAVNLAHWGLATAVDRQSEVAFVGSDRIVVSLHRGPEQAPLEICGHIRQRQEHGDQLHYGIEFDWENTPGSLHAQRALTLMLVRLKKK